MEKSFMLRENTHNVRNFQEISNENRKIVKYRVETISNRAPFLWENLPNYYKLALLYMISIENKKLALR